MNIKKLIDFSRLKKVSLIVDKQNVNKDAENHVSNGTVYEIVEHHPNYLIHSQKTKD